MIKSLNDAVAANNTYAALTLALSLPDICCYAKHGRTSGKRYAEWFGVYVEAKYRQMVGAWQLGMGMQVTFLNGDDCYALRCAFLHEARDEILEQRARQALERFVFVEPGFGCHSSILNGTLLSLQVDRFCKDIADGVEQFLNDVVGDAEVQNRISMQARVLSRGEDIPGLVVHSSP